MRCDPLALACLEPSDNGALIYSLAKPLLFRLDAERAHDLTLGALRLASHSELLPHALHRACAHADPRLITRAFGLTFPNPLGLAAGLDKNGVAVPALAALGFGSVEVGSVTAQAQAGNPRKRLFRLVEDEALINRMGFNNAGADAVARNLRAARGRLKRPPTDSSSVTNPAVLVGGRFRPPPTVVGVNVGKSRVVELADAPDDYRQALNAVWNVADYLVINVSSPNTPGLRSLQQREPLVRLLKVTAALAVELGPRPVLLKLSPDLAVGEIDELVAVAHGTGVAGLIATNTTVERSGLRSPNAVESGGLSGLPLRRRAVEVLEHLRAQTELPIVSVGGVASAEDAVERLRAGADLLQLYTALIYRGPGLVGELLRGLLRELDRRGLNNVSELRD